MFFHSYFGFLLLHHPWIHFLADSLTQRSNVIDVNQENFEGNFACKIIGNFHLHQLSTCSSLFVHRSYKHCIKQNIIKIHKTRTSETCTKKYLTSYVTICRKNLLLKHQKSPKRIWHFYCFPSLCLFGMKRRKMRIGD